MIDQPPNVALHDSARRFDIDLLVIHPAWSPAKVTEGFGLEPTHAHGVGDDRTTPAGGTLAGAYRDTRRRHAHRYEIEEQGFALEVESFVEALEPRRAFLDELRSTGGRASLILCFLGDGYLGDDLSSELLKRMVDLGLTLGIECFAARQT